MNESQHCTSNVCLLMLLNFFINLQAPSTHTHIHLDTRDTQLQEQITAVQSNDGLTLRINCVLWIPMRNELINRMK